ncbi:MAG: prolipoprotein diacylglyceryl transferase [Clostridia bacterium]|nr:prolipoprotein diacylglyceryl transferase [Clostridia bacterium]
MLSFLKYGFFGQSFETSRFAGQAIPWIMTIKATEDSIPTYCHPTFLYESLWNVIGLVILLLVFRKKQKKFSGQLLLLYLIWYGVGRMFIEGFRTDSLFLGNIRISQLVALGCVIFGILFYVLLRRKAKPRLAAEQDSKAYSSLFRERKSERQPEEEYTSMFVREEPATEPEIVSEPIPEEPETAGPESVPEPEEPEQAEEPQGEPEPEAEIRAEEPAEEPEAPADGEEKTDERTTD